MNLSFSLHPYASFYLFLCSLVSQSRESLPPDFSGTLGRVGRKTEETASREKARCVLRDLALAAFRRGDLQLASPAARVEEPAKHVC